MVVANSCLFVKCSMCLFYNCGCINRNFFICSLCMILKM